MRWPWQRREQRDTSLAATLEVMGLPMRGSSGLAAGVPVTDDSAMRLGAVWGCVDLLSEVISTLPVDEFRRLSSTRLVELPKPQVLEDPAGDGTGFEVWARQMMTSWLLRGNAFGLVQELDATGWPSQIESLHPDRVAYRRQNNQGPGEWFLDNRPIDLEPRGQLWHVPAYVVPGSRIGLSPIRYAAETVSLGLAAQQFGGQWFRDGAHPTSVFESDHEIDDRQAKKIKDRINEVRKDNRETLVLGLGGRLKPIQVSPDESQFLETIKANADDIARFFFRRPPGEGGQVTYANVEARSLDMLTYTIGPWLVRFERALSRLRPRPRIVKFNADAIVRVDLATRYKAHESSIRAGWKQPDEVRELENLPSLPRGAGKLTVWPPYTTTAPAAVKPAAAPAGGNGGQPGNGGELDAAESLPR